MIWQGFCFLFFYREKTCQLATTGYVLFAENKMTFFHYLFLYLCIFAEDAIIFGSSFLGVEPGDKDYPLFLAEVEEFLVDKLFDLDPNGESDSFSSPFDPLFRLLIYGCPELFDLFLVAFSVTGILFLSF